jgi:hypothetical protein
MVDYGQNQMQILQGTIEEFEHSFRNSNALWFSDRNSDWKRYLQGEQKELP